LINDKFSDIGREIEGLEKCQALQLGFPSTTNNDASYFGPERLIAAINKRLN